MCVANSSVHSNTTPLKILPLRNRMFIILTLTIIKILKVSPLRILKRKAYVYKHVRNVGEKALQLIKN